MALFLSNNCIPKMGEDGGQCSGRGVCVTADNITSFCMCSPGWSSVGDLASDASVDCGISVVAVRILWGICIIPELILFILAFRRLSAIRFKLDFSRVETNAFFGSLIHGLFMALAAILHTTSENLEETTIGNSPLVTAFFAIGASGFFFANTRFTTQMNALAVKQAKLTAGESQPLQQRRFRTMMVFTQIAFVAGLAGAFVPFGIVTWPGQTDQIFVSFHYVLCAITALQLIAASEIVIAPLKRHIQEVSRRQAAGVNLQTYVRTIAIFESTILQCRVNATVMLILNILMAAVPLLGRKASYQMPLAWTLIGFASIGAFHKVGAFSTSSSTHKTKTSDGSRIKEDGGTYASSNKVTTMPVSTVGSYAA